VVQLGNKQSWHRDGAGTRRRGRLRYHGTHLSQLLTVFQKN
jgi:hypothetical protein